MAIPNLDLNSLPENFSPPQSDLLDLNDPPQSLLLNLNEPQEIDAQQPRRWLTNEQRHILFDNLLSQSKDGKLSRGSLKQAAAKYSVSTRIVDRIWKEGKKMHRE